MNKLPLNSNEIAALELIKTGHVVDAKMLKHLIDADLVDSLLGGPRISKKGLEALGDRKRSPFYR